MAEQEITTKKLWAAILIAVLGGNFTGLLNRISPDMRADPLTGSQAQVAHDLLRTELHRIDRIQYNMDLRMKQREAADKEAMDWIRQHERRHP